MSKATMGMVTGVALGFAGYFGGAGAFFLVAGLGALGLILGSFLQGDLSVGDFVRRRDEGRRSREDFGHQEEFRRSREDTGRQEKFGHAQSDFRPPRSRVR